MTSNTKSGCYCINNRQNGTSCKDYEVRYQCEKYPPSKCCWSKWMNRDHPSGTGDWETLNDFKSLPCNNPSAI